MPSRWMQIFIVAFWLVMTGWLVRRELLPRLGYGDLTFRALSADRPVEENCRWRISVDSRPLGVVDTSVRPEADGSVAWINRAELLLNLAGSDSEKNESKVSLRSEFRVDRAGRLTSLQIRGFLPGTDVRGWIEGAVLDDTLNVRMQLASLPVKEFDVPIKAEMLMSDKLAPLDRFPKLWVGRQWTTRSVDPLSVIKAAGGFFGGGEPSIDVVWHRVVGIEAIVWDNRPRMCYQIESRYPSSAASTWVRTADNRVLRHEQTVLGGLKVVMELEQSNE